MQSRDQNNNINQQKMSVVEIVKEKKALIGLGILTIAILAGAVLFLSKEGSTSTPKEGIVSSAGLHWHPNLTISIDGKKQELPASLGVTGGVHQKIHTHDTDAKDGVVHIEAQGIVSKEDIKLSNFFRIWGKEFSSTKLFDKTNGPKGKVKMKVNGKENLDFDNYQMREDDKIEISYK